MIYALIDQNNNIRYIGQTKQKLYKRKSQHKRFALVDMRNGYKDNWIRNEYNHNKEINIILIEECGIKTANEREEYWIQVYKDKGCKLTNTQSVGKRNYKSGRIGWSKEQKKHFRLIAKNYKHNIFYVELGEVNIRVWKNDYDLTDVTNLKAGQKTDVAPREFHQFESVQDSIVYEIYYSEPIGNDIVRETVGGQI